MKFETFEIPAIIVIGVIGVFLNSTSLCFFVKREWKSLANQLITTLIISDLCVCLLYPVFAIYYRYKRGLVFDIVSLLTSVAILCSGLTATTLAVSRCYSIKRPFHVQSRRMVWSGFLAILIPKLVIFGIIMMTATQYVPSILVFSLNTPLLLTNVITSVITIRELAKSKNSESRANSNRRAVILHKKYALVTVLIISITYCGTNTVGWLAWLIRILTYQQLKQSSLLYVLDVLVELFLLNSVANAIILLARKRVIIFHFRKLFGCIAPA